jgi:hypothetical protein
MDTSSRGRAPLCERLPDLSALTNEILKRVRVAVGLELVCPNTVVAEGLNSSLVRQLQGLRVVSEPSALATII